MSFSPSPKSALSPVAARRTALLESAVAPLFEGLEQRSHFSVTPTAVAGGPYTVAEGQSVVISGLASTDSDGTVAGYQWDTNYNAAKGFKNRITTGSWTFHADTSGTRTVALKVIDNNGDVSGIQTATITVTDVAPTLTLVAPSTADEGKPVNIAWSYTDPGQGDTVTSWGVDWGDGTTGTYAGDITNATHTYAENDSYDVKLTATQADAVTHTTHTISVGNVTPLVEASAPHTTIDEGEFVQMFFNSPNRQSTLDGWTIDWGDGKVDQLESTRSLVGHFYTDSGVYTATAKAQEPDGGYGTATVVYTVRNVDPEITQTNVPATGNEGTAITVGSTMTDAGVDDTHTYAWSVYRNGTRFTLPGGTDTASANFTFTPTDNGNYVVRLSVMDDEGGVATVNSDPIVVANVAPTVTITGTPGTAINEGGLVSLTANANDAGSEDVSSLTYAWTVTKDNAAYALPQGVATDAASLQFTPGDNGSYVATVVVTDKDNGTVSVSSSAITVNNVAPTATINGAPTTANENDPISVSATVNDAGKDDTHTYQWGVEKVTGPGLSTMTLPAGSGASAQVSNYAFNNTYHPVLMMRVKLPSMADGQTVTLINFRDTASTGGLVNWSLQVTKSGGAYSMVLADSRDGANTTGVPLDASIAEGGFFDYGFVASSNARFVFYANGTPLLGQRFLNYALPSNNLDVTMGDNGVEYDRLVTYSDINSIQQFQSQYLGTQYMPTPIDRWEFADAVDSNVAASTGSKATDMALSNATLFNIPAEAAFTLPNTVVTTGKTFGFTPTDNGTYKIKLTVTDKDGAAVSTQTSSITVNNVDPVGTITGDDAADEGSAVHYSVAVVDAADDTQSYAWSVTKDNVAYTLPGGTVTNASTFDFTPADDGGYVVSVLITDKDGGHSTATHNLTVANVAPTASMTAPTTGTEGGVVSATSTSSDAGTDDVLSYAWSVTKDGQAYTLPGGVAVDGQSFAFTPVDNGTYVLTLVVSDGDTGTKTVTSDPIVVANAAPTATISGEPGSSIVEGATVNLTATPADAGTLDTFSYAWSIKKDGVAYNPGETVDLTSAALSFVAKDNGTYVATVIVKDNDGDTVSKASQPIVVTNANPNATILNAPASGNEGAAITVGSQVTDAGSLDTHTYQWGVEKQVVGTTGGTVRYGNGMLTNYSFDDGTLVLRTKISPSLSDHSGNILIAQNTGSPNYYSWELEVMRDGTDYNFELNVYNNGHSSGVTAKVPLADVGTDFFTLALKVDKANNNAVAFNVNGTDYAATGALTDSLPTNTRGPVYFSNRTDFLGFYDAQLAAADVADLQAGNAISTTARDLWNFDEAPGSTSAVSNSGTVMSVTNNPQFSGPAISYVPVTLPAAVKTDGQSFTFTPSDNGTYRVKLLVTDKDNGTATATSGNIVIANVAPTGSLTGPATSDEGSAVKISASATDAGSDDLASLAYAWSVTKDGQNVSLPMGTVSNGVDFDYTPADQGEYVFTCVVSDKDNGSKTLTHTLTVSNVAPTVSLTDAPATGTEGSPITIGSTATDPGDDTLSYAWTVTRNGQAYALPNDVSVDGPGLTFTPNDNGSYVVTLKVSDEDAGVTTKTATIAVAGVAPAATVSGPSVGTEGQSLGFGSTVTDASTADTATGFTYAWTATRGSTVVATSATSSFDFTPGVHGAYTVKLVVTDKDGLSVTKTSQVSVANVAPTNVTLTGSRTGIVEGQAVSFTAGATDAPNDALSYTWNVKKGDTLFASGNGSNVNFTAARGDYTITVTATDTASAAASQSFAMSVGNVAPTGTMTAPVGNVLVNSNASFGLTVGDVPVKQNLTVTWDFGDSSTLTETLVAGQVVSRGHTYNARGTYTVKATIFDGVDTTVVTKTVSVSEATVITDPNDNGKQSLVVVGSDNNDTIDVSQQTSGKYAVTYNGVSLGTAFAPNGRIYVYGNGGANTITVSGKTDAIVFAGTNAASSVSTGAGNDVIVGTPGADRLSSGAGNDIVIGGMGSDTIHGNEGEDAIVAYGLTKMNDSPSAVSWAAIWNNGTSISARRNTLVNLFSKQTVNDAGGNQLYGETGNDWFVLNSAADKLKDLQSTDLVN